jgi:hypothetical protein
LTSGLFPFHPDSVHRLKGRGETGDSNEAEESRVEDQAGSAVGLILVVAVATGAAVAAIGGVVGLVVGLLVLGDALEGTLDLAIAALASGSRLAELLADGLDVRSAGNKEGTLDALKLGEFNPDGKSVYSSARVKTDKLTR